VVSASLPALTLTFRFDGIYSRSIVYNTYEISDLKGDLEFHLTETHLRLNIQ